MTQVFDLEKCSILKTLLQVFKRENDLILCNDGFLIHLYLLDPQGLSYPSPFWFVFQHHPGVLAGGNA